MGDCANQNEQSKSALLKTDVYNRLNEVLQYSSRTGINMSLLTFETTSVIENGFSFAKTWISQNFYRIF